MSLTKSQLAQIRKSPGIKSIEEDDYFEPSIKTGQEILPLCHCLITASSKNMMLNENLFLQKRITCTKERELHIKLLKRRQKALW